MERGAGLLMPLASLPNAYGIGTMGKEAYKFVDFAVKSKQKYWQVLPLNPTSYGDSPYQSPSSFALNPYYMDIEGLAKEGLLTKAELEMAKHDTLQIDYYWLFQTRVNLLKIAFSRFDRNNKEFVSFCKNNAWVEEYGLFMSLKEKNGYASWNTWCDEEKFRKDVTALKTTHADSIAFWQFVQFKLFAQWKALRDYANSNGIQIVGDMPIYVAEDSVEVWSKPDDYLLDENYAPKLVAGCPPDGFSPDGQRWGNPIYNWDKMKADGFTWWVERIKHALSIYDVLRIDHFRGFAGYYVIPAQDQTARNGWWVEGCGTDLFKVVLNEVKDAKIIAEDLGYIDQPVRDLLAFTNFPGMKILQFAFYDDDAEYLPENYPTDNCVVYTGTHDSYTTREWFETLGDEPMARLKAKVPMLKTEHPTTALIKMAMNSRADMAIIPVGDYMNLGTEARINSPSTLGGNWVWRLSKDYNRATLRAKIEKLTLAGNR